MPYKTSLLNSLREFRHDEPLLPDPDQDKAALDASMDDSATDGQYEIDGGDTSPVDIMMQWKERAEKWANSLEGFADWINSTKGDALISNLQKAQESPGFAGIAEKSLKDVEKVATTVAGLRQKINIFINTADSKLKAFQADGKKSA